MGLLRVLLAFSVILAHSQSFYGFFGMGGSAVPSFFIISGFYMSLILTGKYNGPSGLWLFYSNRFLRLYPMYWAVLVVFVIFAFIGSQSWPFAQINIMARNPLKLATDGSLPSLLALIPNLTFVGADVIRVFVVDLETMQVSPWLSGMVEGARYRALAQYLIIPPIWSLGVEVLFYAAAPFIVRLRLFGVLLLGASTLALHAFYHSWFSETLNWYHLPTPYNLVYFMLGIIAHRLSPHLLRLWPLRWPLMMTPFAILVFWQLLSTDQLTNWLLWTLFAAGVPVLFEATRRSRLDGALGAYAYPMYLCHTLFAWPMQPLGPWAGIAAAVLSAGLSYLLLTFVDQPIEAWRQRRVARAVVPPATAAGTADVAQGGEHTRPSLR